MMMLNKTILIKCLWISIVVWFYCQNFGFTEELLKQNIEVLLERPKGNWEVFTSRNKIQTLLLSDDKKYLWIGTEGGLEKRSFLDFHLEKKYTIIDGFPSHTIYCLISDSKGGIWIGTDGGLLHLKSDGTLDVINESNSELPANRILTLLRDSKDGIWIGTYRGLVHLKVSGQWEVFDEENSDLPDNHVDALLDDGQGGLWIGTFGGGLAHMNQGGTWSVYNSSNSGLPDDAIVSLLSGDQGGVWVGLYNEGLAYFTLDHEWIICTEDNSYLPDNAIGALIPDGQGGIWIGTRIIQERYDVGGLARLKADGTWEVFDSDNSNLPSYDIESLISDDQGGIWVGTSDGLVYFSNGAWSILTSESELPKNNVQVICPDGQNGLWIGMSYSGGGLTHMKPDGEWAVYNTTNSDLPDRSVESIVPDGQGGVWVGTGGGLLHIASDNTWTVFTSSNSEMQLNGINHLVPDGENGIWMGGFGLEHLTITGDWEFFNDFNSEMPHPYVEILISDGEGGVWMRTYNSGVVHLNSDGTWNVFSKFQFGIPYCMLSDENGGLWVGSYVGFWHLFSPDIWDFFDHNNSELPDSSVFSLSSDGEGGIWALTLDDDIVHLNVDGHWEVFNSLNSDLPTGCYEIDYSTHQGVWVACGTNLAWLNHNNIWHTFTGENSYLPGGRMNALSFDHQGGIWIGALYGLAHLMQIGMPEQIIDNSSLNITIEWFVYSASIDSQKVEYLELQRSLSKTGPYETVRDTLNSPVRFYVDYTDCLIPRVENCWPSVQGHTPAYQGEGETRIKGYTLDIPITDPEWLEGLPRYYRLASVIEENGEFIRVADNSESTLMAPAVEENPRIDLSLETSAIALYPGTGTDVTLFVSSLDLFTGEVKLDTSLISEIPDEINIQSDPATVTLKPGETVPVLLNIEISPEAANTSSTIQIKPATLSGDSQFKSTSLKVFTGTEPMAALGIAHTTRRPRVMDGITVSGNIVPAQSGQEVIITGKNAVSNSKIEIDPLTLRADDKGFFEGSIFPENAGDLVLTAQSAGTPSNSAEIFILPAKNHIALTSNVNQATSQKDNLTIEGIITPVRPAETITNAGTKSRLVNLDIRYLDPDDSQAGLQPQFVGNVKVDENGKFTKEIVVPGDGFINVKASLPETPDYLGIETKLVIPIGQPVGEGIIVVSESGDAEFQEISKSLGKYVYNTLKTRNIPGERIRYLGGADDESSIPVDGYADKSNLHHALTEWAVSLISTDDPYKT
ncbi:MAG: hypothetical protein HQK65_15660, partial [Desulfamplus sp.]|nr:hypothetical protein [Desulfamplus sp.]